MGIGPSEAETFWTAFLRKLARRGLRGVKLAEDAFSLCPVKAKIAYRVFAKLHRIDDFALPTG